MKYFMGILIFVVAFCPTSIFGQPALAVKGGLNMATFRGDIANQYPLHARVGVRLGVSATFPVKGKLGFQFNSDYAQKSVYGGFDDFLVKLDCIEFSGLAKVTIISLRRAPSLYILVGSSAEVKIKSTGEDQLARTLWRDRLEFSSVDFSIIAGVGAQMTFSKTMIINAEILFAEGVSDIDDIRGYSVLNRAFIFQIGLGIPVLW